MYGKIFESIFKSTLVSEGGWLPTYIFMSMIVLADKDGIVDFAHKTLFQHIGFRDYDSKITYEDFMQAVEYLEREDPYSNSDAENGKRIIPLSEIKEINGNRGWLVVNYLEYRKKASSIEPKGSSTERVRKFRARQKKRNETVCNGVETDGNGHTDTDTDTDTDTRYKFLLADGSIFYPTKKYISHLQDLYPQVDLAYQFAKIEAWCLSNEKKRKTRNGATRFINGWMGKAADKLNNNGVKNPTPDWF